MTEDEKTRQRMYRKNEKNIQHYTNLSCNAYERGDIETANYYDGVVKCLEADDRKIGYM